MCARAREKGNARERERDTHTHTHTHTHTRIYSVGSSECESLLRSSVLLELQALGALLPQVIRQRRRLRGARCKPFARMRVGAMGAIELAFQLGDALLVSACFHAEFSAPACPTCTYTYSPRDAHARASAHPRRPIGFLACTQAHTGI